MSINRHATVPLTWIMMSSLLLGMVLSVFNSWFNNMVTLLSWLVSTDYGTCLHQRSLSNLSRTSVHMLQSSWAHARSYHVIVLLWILGTQIMWSTLSYCWHRLHLLLLLLKFIKNSLKFIRVIFNFCITAMFVTVGSMCNMSDIMSTMFNLSEQNSYPMAHNG
jgi:hypothetical protein